MSIILDKVNYIYSAGTAYEKQALKDISLTIQDGEFIGIIGHTGSGKSTLIQHLNGLEKATSGGIYYNGQDIYDPDFEMKELRSKVGLVFQYPEHQLFETTVLEDVKFGPRNQKLDKLEVDMRAFEALKLVGLSEKYYDASPFELSGGQKRRAAIAGVLAMKPDVLILDEPTAGLDPKGRDEILDQIARLHREQGITVILVSHSMEDVANYVGRIIVMNHGQVALDGKPKEVFAHYKELEEIGLSAPQVTYVMNGLKEAGYPVDTTATTVAEAKDEILRMLSGGGRAGSKYVGRGSADAERAGSEYADRGSAGAERAGSEYADRGSAGAERTGSSHAGNVDTDERNVDRGSAENGKAGGHK